MQAIPCYAADIRDSIFFSMRRFYNLCRFCNSLIEYSAILTDPEQGITGNYQGNLGPRPQPAAADITQWADDEKERFGLLRRPVPIL
jgi:hypothetical protein